MEPEKVRQITYSNENEDLVVKISENFHKILLSNGKEHFILKGIIQRKLSHIKDKFVRHSMYLDDSFYIVCSKNYDRDIDILNTRLDDFNASIKRSIEPGLMKILDMCIYKSNL